MKKLKIYKTQHLTEIYTYPPNLINRKTSKRTNYKKRKKPLKQSTIKRINRNRKTIVRLINNNFTTNHKFITLTYAEKNEDFVLCKLHWKLFIKNLKANHKFKNLKYLVIIERHKDGSLHMHALMSIGYIPHDKLTKYWGKGHIFINNLKRLKNLSSYVVKYLTKDLNPPPRIPLYIRSKNLIPPDIIETNNIMEAMTHIPLNYYYKKSGEYTSEYGTIRFTQYLN